MGAVRHDGSADMRPTSQRVRALQAVMLRLTVDPRFGQRVYNEDVVSIELPGGCYTLTAEDVEMVRAVDQRAWTTDRFRRARFTQALIEEYLLTTALVGVAEVDAFFGSEAFAKVLTHRGAMAEAFGEWITDRIDPRARPFARLEAAVARARRPHREGGLGLVTAPGKEGVQLPEGTLAQWQAGLAALGDTPLASVAQGARWQAPPLARSREHLLVERMDTGELGVHVLSAGVVGLLKLCRTPRRRSEVGRAARQLKVPKKQVAATIRRMIDEGLLVERLSPSEA